MMYAFTMQNVLQKFKRRPVFKHLIFLQGIGAEAKADTCKLCARPLSPSPGAPLSHLPAGHTEGLASTSYCYCSLPHPWKSGLKEKKTK